MEKQHGVEKPNPYFVNGDYISCRKVEETKFYEKDAKWSDLSTKEKVKLVSLGAIATTVLTTVLVVGTNLIFKGRWYE